MKTDFGKVLDYLAESEMPAPTQTSITEQQIEQIEQKLTEKIDNLVKSATDPGQPQPETQPQPEPQQTATETAKEQPETNNINE